MLSQSIGTVYGHSHDDILDTDRTRLVQYNLYCYHTITAKLMKEYRYILYTSRGQFMSKARASYPDYGYWILHTTGQMTFHSADTFNNAKGLAEYQCTYDCHGTMELEVF